MANERAPGGFFSGDESTQASTPAQSQPTTSTPFSSTEDAPGGAFDGGPDIETFQSVVQGPKGDKGDTGDQGVQGPIGLTGPQGDRGLTGVQGAQGVSITNVTGTFNSQTFVETFTITLSDGTTFTTSTGNIRGATGAQGATGATGLTGQTGAQGLRGSGITSAAITNSSTNAVTGDITYTLTFTYDDATTSTATFVAPRGPQGLRGLQGIQGDRGVPGADGTDGATGPAGADGVTPSFSATATGIAEGLAPVATVNNADPARPVLNLQIPAGATGPAGADSTVAGPQGPQGPQGVQGVQGPIGPAGPAGADSTVPGPQGPAGTNGTDGARGPMGAQGPAGPAGADGTDGAQGPQGVQGPQGPIGPAGPTGADGQTGPQGSRGLPGPTGPQGPAGADGTNGTDGTDGVVTAVNIATGADYVTLTSGTLAFTQITTSIPSSEDVTFEPTNTTHDTGVGTITFTYTVTVNSLYTLNSVVPTVPTGLSATAPVIAANRATFVVTVPISNVATFSVSATVVATLTSSGVRHAPVTKTARIIVRAPLPHWFSLASTSVPTALSQMVDNGVFTNPTTGTLSTTAGQTMYVALTTRAGGYTFTSGSLFLDVGTTSTIGTFTVYPLTDFTGGGNLVVTIREA